MSANRPKPGSIFDVISKLKSVNLSAEERNRQLRQVGWSYLAILAVTLVAGLLLMSCWVSSCRGNSIRPMLIVILVGYALVIGQVFLALRVTGRNALPLFIILTSIVILLIGRVVGLI